MQANLLVGMRADETNFMRFFWVITFFLLGTMLYSQENDFENEYEEEEEFIEIRRVHFVELSFSLYRPLDVFAEKIDPSLLSGFSLGYLIQLQKEKPSFLGFEVFHMHLGNYSTMYDGIVGIEQLELNGRVASNALGMNINYRHYLPLKWGRLEPYVEGQFGTKWMYSYLSETGVFFDEEPYDNFDFLTSEWSLTYGGAAGLQFHLADDYYLNLKASYHLAVSGEYERRITENLDFVEFPQEAFETVQSATNMAKIDIGMTFLF